jgi:hypothetical protein
MVKTEATTHFAPYQFGAAAKCGTERVVHRTRAIFDAQRHSHDFVLFKVDLSNAFNNVSRAQMLEQVQAVFPKILPWMQWCYGQGSNLTFGEFIIKSLEGTQQGDPLGSLGFAVSLHPIVLRIAAACPALLANLWYLDDGVIGGAAADVLKAIQILQHDGPHLGMFVNYAKCEIHSHPASQAAAHRLRDDANGIGMCVPKDKVFTEGNTTLLGAPIGSPAFCAEYVDKECVRPTITALAALRELRDPQVALTLLKNCSGYCAFVHALRTTPPSTEFATAAAQFDSAVLSAFDHYFGPLPRTVHHQIRMATRIGGIGLRSSTEHHAAAYASSVSTCAKLDGWDPMTAAGYVDALAHLATVTAPPHDTTAILAAAQPDTQQLISRAIDDKTLTDVLATTDLHTTIRLRSQSGPHAAAWLTVLPSHDAGFAYTHKEYRTLIRWWLGLPVYEDAKPCRQCGSPNDVDGYHALTCRCWGGRIYRHHALANVLATYMQSAHHNPQREKGFDGASRPADVLIPHWELGQPLAIDLAVTHPLQPNNTQKAGDRTSGSWASDYARAFKDQQAAPLAAHGVAFAPLVVETYGSWDPAGYALLHQCAAKYAMHQGISPAVAVRVLFQRLSVTLMRMNARMILARDPPPTDVPEVPTEMTDNDLRLDLMMEPAASMSPWRDGNEGLAEHDGC